ncbi:MAG: hypothetical protein L6Q99_21700 [Planctomycetes bacterium]|nr:hypothetical protein [Planctomycetota bacterium]
MREFVEFRIREENAAEYLPAGTGESVGYGVRRVVVETSDPLFSEIGRLHRMFRAQGEFFFSGREYRRRYGRRELVGASLLHVWPKRVFEPAGEECGTVYDESAACDHVFAHTPETKICGQRVPSSIDTCGAGARQATPLFLDGRRIPRNVDFTRTIAGEIVVSARVVKVFQEQGLRGAEFDAIRLSNRHGEPSHDHYQWKVVGNPVELDSATRAGEDPFDEHAYGRCPRSHLVGLNLLSEVTVKGETIPESDVTATRQMVGVRRGLLRPRPMLLLSPRAWRAIEKVKLKGLVVEVAHVR